MSVLGKAKTDWLATTYCDFGEPGRRSAITRHFFMETAERRFKETLRIYGKHGWNCWQEDQTGNVIRGTKP